MFVDQVKITAKAGNGGNGAVSFHREKFVQNGGPDGGDGGNGGDIVLLADPNMHTLMDFRYKRKYTADNGENGAAALCRGKSAKDLIIKVPVGTTVRLVSCSRAAAAAGATRTSPRRPVRRRTSPSRVRNARSPSLNWSSRASRTSALSATRTSARARFSPS